MEQHQIVDEKLVMQQSHDKLPKGAHPKDPRISSGWSTDAMHFLIAFMIKEDDTLSSFANNGMMVAKKKQAFETIQEQFNSTYPEQYKTIEQIRSKMKSLRHQAKTIACYRTSGDMDQVPSYLVSLVHMLQRKGVTMNASPPTQHSFFPPPMYIAHNLLDSFNQQPAKADNIKVEASEDGVYVDVCDAPSRSNCGDLSSPSGTATIHAGPQLVNFDGAGYTLKDDHSIPIVTNSPAQMANVQNWNNTHNSASCSETTSSNGSDGGQPMTDVVKRSPDQESTRRPSSPSAEALQKRKLVMEIEILEMKKVKLGLEQHKLRQEIRKLR